MPSKDEMYAFFKRFRDMETSSCNGEGGVDSLAGVASMCVSSPSSVGPSDLGACAGAFGDSGESSPMYGMVGRLKPMLDGRTKKRASIAQSLCTTAAAKTPEKCNGIQATKVTVSNTGHITLEAFAASLITQADEKVPTAAPLLPALKIAHPPTSTPRAAVGGKRSSFLQRRAGGGGGASGAATPHSVPSLPLAVPQRLSLLPPLTPSKRSPVTLVLDVDETLVHSSFSPHDLPFDLELPVTHNNQKCTVYVKLRPFLFEFLDFVSSRFEIVVFTASVSAYCNPLMDLIDPLKKLGPHRLFREHCTKADTSHIKDLTMLGRSLERVAIIDNSPTAYYFQPRNAIPIISWFSDPDDTELLKLLPLLANLATCESVYDHLDEFNGKGENSAAEWCGGKALR